jgi:hypothetical protein
MFQIFHLRDFFNFGFNFVCFPIHLAMLINYTMGHK